MAATTAQVLPAGPTLRLLQYSPAWGAPSVDPRCTKAQAYLRVCGRSYEVEDASAAAPGWSPLLLPVLRDGARAVEPDGLYAHLREGGIDADAKLSAEERAESAAWTALVEERLGLALLYACWAEEDNYAAVLKPAYAQRLPLPLCLYLPWTMRRRALSQLARREGVAYRLGGEALEALNTRLTGRGSFFASGASAAFSYLTAVLRCPLPRDTLRAHLKSLPALCSYERSRNAVLGALGGALVYAVGGEEELDEYAADEQQ
ncbi:Metaxin [Emiliania huxleyi CCMP1516]|uniref:Mitochondrial outer membrane transport complex Sam37/metaxin N-terminal domain-containing protein n=2 Tax=Emiliania huxleyi TaxID=2903 RepID=A0A0D3L261_EMIH1|nr:Metaxin [Emiliania huxleyi CCMP1516]EOD42096.1 Metaxin [Emiliania huxleyi CCMP1516]|eukprot:XP_005794525.1 Metaxin [Emiliania huxleyi CCMP1516]